MVLSNEEQGRKKRYLYRELVIKPVPRKYKTMGREIWRRKLKKVKYLEMSTVGHGIWQDIAQATGGKYISVFQYPDGTEI